ncbi:MAG: hypothetical protein ACYC2H_08240 [Thermoplasmatota archaeon]
MTDRPLSPPPPKGWEALARQQSRWLFDLLRLVVLALLALLGPRLL